MLKIMIIEDDPAIREELTLLLKNEGYTPLAITEFTDIPGQATRERPDLILLDIGLPGRDGFLRRIAEGRSCASNFCYQPGCWCG